MFSYKIVATTSTVADLEETYGGTFSGYQAYSNNPLQT